MGRKTQIKRERRTDIPFAASLTTCAGTWLEHAPDAAEQQRIEVASRALRQQRRVAIEFHQDGLEANRFSIELFRSAEFHPLHLDDWLIAQILDTVGEPPIVEDEQHAEEFTNYLQRAVLSIANAQVRRALAGQLRRYLPRYTEAGQWKEAVAIDHNAFRTALGNEVTPFLVQMTLEGLARWYETYEDDEALQGE